jgi:hypothetical protein
MMQDSRAGGKLNPITLQRIKSTHLITGFKEVGRSRSMQGLHLKTGAQMQDYMSAVPVKNVQGTDSQARPPYGKTSLIMTQNRLLYGNDVQQTRS